MNQQTKILHIFDDEEITKSTIDLYKNLKAYDQTFLIITDDEKKWSNIFPSNDSVQILINSSNLISQLRQLINNYDIIFLQALSYHKAKAISIWKFNKKVFIWALWGYELYNIFNYFSSQDNQYLSTTEKKKTGIINKLRDIYIFDIVYKKAVKKIDICLFLLKKDFELLSSSLHHNAVWMTSCYQTIENIYGEKRTFTIRGNSILIGNSSALSNRHERVFNILEGANIENRSLVVPLSYGDSDYREKILEQGEKLFREQFRPLINFMKMDDYLEEIKTCSHVIMAHERQQGFGSIIMMLLGGAKVFLSSSSPLYDWFKKLDIIIYCVERDLPRELNGFLTNEEKEHNKRILTKYLSEESVLLQLKEVIDKAISISESRLKIKS